MALIGINAGYGGTLGFTLWALAGNNDGQWHDYQLTYYTGGSYVDVSFYNNYSASAVPGAAALYVADLRIVEGIVPKPRTK